MKEIKFRAWDGIRMTASGIQINSVSGLVLVAANMPLMQFTGLKDKNGNEIYEGDILKYSIQGCKQDNPLVVDHENLIIGLNHDDSYYSMDEESFEVIGNIYENPEPLKEER